MPRPRYIPPRRGAMPMLRNRERMPPVPPRPGVAAPPPPGNANAGNDGAGGAGANPPPPPPLPQARDVSYRAAGIGQRRFRNYRIGDFTGAVKPAYPRVFRRFGHNTRAWVGYKHTGIWDNKYEAEIVESKPLPPFLSSRSTLAHAGAPSIVNHIPALRPGTHHWLFDR